MVEMEKERGKETEREIAERRGGRERRETFLFQELQKLDFMVWDII